MAIDAHQFRCAVGAFQQRNHSVAPPSHAARMAARYPRTESLRLNSATNTTLALLQVSAALGSLRPTPTLPGSARGGAVDAGTANSTAMVATAPRPAASMAPPASAPLLPASLATISNGAASVCIAQPTRCAGALAGGALIGTALYVGAGLLAHLPQQPEAPIAHSEETLPPSVQDQLALAAGSILLPPQHDVEPRTLEQALLRIADECAGDLHCRAHAINHLLLQLPPTSLQTLQAIVRATAPIDDPAAATSGWPLGAAASPVLPDLSLDALIGALSHLYTADVAHFQADMERIVHATSTQGDARRDTIRQLLAETGREVEQQTFNAPSRYNRAQLLPGTNLKVTLRSADEPNGAASPARHLMLVAHGDAKGQALGSEGAYDNASGVAALLHVLRGIDTAALPAGTAISVLITDLEERHLLGSQHAVDECMRNADCPTLVINVDMVGRGGHGIVVSTADELIDHPYLGRAPMNLQAPRPEASERLAAEQLLTTFGAHGFQRHPAGGGLLLTSDNLAFQNASIPTLGVAQMSAADATAMVDIERARLAYERSSDTVDWMPYLHYRRGTVSLAPETLQQYETAIKATKQAYDDLNAKRSQWPHSPGQRVHTGKDRLHTVSPTQGVAFADALLEVAHTWLSDPHGIDQPSTTTH